MPPIPIKGRGAVSQTPGRFDARSIDLEPSAEDSRLTSAGTPAPTELTAMPAGRIISSNQSPDIPFDRSINPYQGCEHGCVYCYARPSHSYLDLSPGLDFETKIFYKPNAVARLVEAWEKPAYAVKPITLGANTDPYQPAEKKLRITRGLLEAFRDYRHPVSVITKGTLIRRDLDLLSELAAMDLASVAVSIPTANKDLKRQLEPRVPAAQARFDVIEELTGAGVPVTLLMAPIIPALNDGEIENILERAADSGVSQAAWILLRLPHELKSVFTEWLEQHYPERATHVMSLLRQSSGGKDYDNRFGRRQTGSGAYAQMLAQRFKVACRKHGLDRGERLQTLDCSQFISPGNTQISFDI
jgi:DNA repair photolyase